jgi:hypothetical protein
VDGLSQVSAVDGEKLLGDNSDHRCTRTGKQERKPGGDAAFGPEHRKGRKNEEQEPGIVGSVKPLPARSVRGHSLLALLR